MHTDAERTLADTLESHGQGHVLRHADSLSPADHKAFHAQLASIDLPLVSRLVKGGAEAKVLLGPPNGRPVLAWMRGFDRAGLNRVFKEVVARQAKLLAAWRQIHGAAE